MKASVPIAVLAIALLVAGQARAEMIDFSYQWTVEPSVVTPPAGGVGVVTLAAAPDGASAAELGNVTGAFIPGATVTTNTSSEPLESFNTPFNMKVHLTDTLSGLAGDLAFTGTVAGELSATQSTLTSTFDTPATKTLELDGRVYTVTISPVLSNLPVPGATAPVLIDAKVTVADKVGTEPPPVGTPEPSGLLLGATAVLGLAARAWRRAKAAKA